MRQADRGDARRGVLLRSAVAAVVAMAVLVATSTVAVAADPTFGTPSAHATFGQGVTFTQPASFSEPPARIEVVLTLPGAIGPEVVDASDQAATGSTTLTYALTEADGHILPNTPISARWRVTDTGGHQTVGPAASITYADGRFEWKSLAGSLVTIHWYNGNDDFGRRALAIAEQGVSKAEKVLGVTESAPIDFFVYADQQAFYDALGPGTRENVGGQSNASIRTMFALITPDELNASWVGIVIPHELTHLVFNTAVENPYHFPPRWLNEGVAVYLSQGYDSSDRATVAHAAGGDALIPLDGLTGQFPTTGDQFAQAYAESVAAIDYLVRTHGQDALVTLIRSYAKGLTDDEAFSAAIGMTVDEFQAAWFSSVGATVPKAVGPQPAPAGPVPPGWSGGSGGPAASGATGEAAPGASAAAGAPAPSSSGQPVPVVPIVLAAVAVALALGGATLILRSRRSPEADRPEPPGVA